MNQVFGFLIQTISGFTKINIKIFINSTLVNKNSLAVLTTIIESLLKNLNTYFKMFQNTLRLSINSALVLYDSNIGKRYELKFKWVKLKIEIDGSTGQDRTADLSVMNATL